VSLTAVVGPVDERASRAVLLLQLFSDYFVLSMVYAEGILLVGAAGCLLLLGRRQWLGAGIAGAVAPASRPHGVVVVVCCAWASIVAIRERREWRSLVAPAVAPLGAVGFFAYLWARTGNSTAWFFVERQGWHEHIDGGRASARLALRFVTDPFHDSTTFIVGLAMLVAVLGVVLLVRLRPPAIVMIYTGGILVVSLMSATLSLRPRFVFTAFPLIFAIADAVPRRLFAACVAMSAALMAILFVYYGLGGPVASAP